MTRARLTRTAAGLALALVSACELERLGSAPRPAEDAGSDAGAGGVFDDAGFGGTGGQAEAEAEAATPLPYSYRRRLTLTPGASGVPVGASIRFELDHRALVLAGKARGDGNDLRLFFKGDGDSQEIDRVLDLASGWDRADTRIWFRVQAPIGPEPGGAYYLYYGDPQAAAALDDPREVYAAFDDFDGTGIAPEWKGEAIGAAQGTFTVKGGVLRIEGKTGDIWDNGDDFLFLFRTLTGNFVAEARVSASGGTAAGWAKLGGVMVRATTDKASMNRMIAPVNGSKAITSSYRLGAGAATEESAKSGPKLVPQVVRIARRFDVTRSWHSPDAVDYSELGAEQTFQSPLPDPALVGIPLANLSPAAGWVEIDWFRAWRWYDHEPALALEPEEPGPFLP
ncbi:MAG: DUF2341 domain-containing protein [Polyangiaceae bacterium]|nr:DUF2341 domain-containing protein [Polyangiaceae bacterium]